MNDKQMNKKKKQNLCEVDGQIIQSTDSQDIPLPVKFIPEFKQWLIFHTSTNNFPCYNASLPAAGGQLKDLWSKGPEGKVVRERERERTTGYLGYIYSSCENMSQDL